MRLTLTIQMSDSTFVVRSLFFISIFSRSIRFFLLGGWYGPSGVISRNNTPRQTHMWNLSFGHMHFFSSLGCLLVSFGLAWLHPPSALYSRLLEMDRGSGKSVSLTCSGGLLHRCCRLQMGKSHFPVLRGPTDATVPLLLLPSYQGLI